MSPSSTPRWPAVLFDLDGTLVDTVELIVQSYQHAFRSVLGAEQPEVRIRAWIGQPLLRCFRQASPEHASALVECYTAWNLANTERLARRYAGIDGLLADLRAAGVHVGVVTSKRRGPADLALARCGLEDLLETVVSLEDTERHKPDPAPLLLAARRLQVGRHETAYVGDAAVDLQAARAAGMSGVGVLWGAGTREALQGEQPAAVVDTVEALRAVLGVSARRRRHGPGSADNLTPPRRDVNDSRVIRVL
ncbi:MAG: HAD family hydrolase [Dermatophilaceae bacterium]